MIKSELKLCLDNILNQLLVIENNEKTAMIIDSYNYYPGAKVLHRYGVKERNHDYIKLVNLITEKFQTYPEINITYNSSNIVSSGPVETLQKLIIDENKLLSLIDEALKISDSTSINFILVSLSNHITCKHIAPYQKLIGKINNTKNNQITIERIFSEIHNRLKKKEKKKFGK